MMSPQPATVIHVAGGAAASPLANTTLSSPPLASRLRGREPSDGDDDTLLLSPNGSATSTKRASVPSRLRRCVARVTRSRIVMSLVTLLSLSGGASWLVKGLCVCLGILVLGGVGSLTLRQLMSPQIESLLAQRKDMLLEMDALREQVANQTRIAESRLDMIHLLEQELDKQVVAAAAAATASVRPGASGGSVVARPQPPFTTPDRQAAFWTTLVYAGVLGTSVLVLLALRIYQIARAENQRVQKARANSDVEVSRGSSSSSNGNGHVALTVRGDESDSGSGKPLASSAYKRAPGGSPTDRLVHV